MGLDSAAYAGLGLLGAGVSAYGQYTAGQEQKKAYDYNAQISEQQAEAARQRGIMDEFKATKKRDIVIGEQQASYAKAGVVITTGSPIDVMTDSLFNADLDIAINKYNNEVAARGYESQAVIEREAGSAAAEEGTVGAVSTLLSAGSKTAYQFSKTKIGS